MRSMRTLTLSKALFAVFVLTVFVLPHVAFAQLPAPFDFGVNSSATAAADGYVVGQSSASGHNHAFIWSASTQTMTDIGAAVDTLVPGNLFSLPTSVNSHGAVVGGALAPDFSTVGFYWSQATGLVSLGQLYPNVQQTTILINENGVVAGVTSDNRLFRWTLAGGFHYLGNAPSSSFPYLSGINANGDIVGGTGDQSVGFVAFASDNVLTLLTSPGTTAPPTNVGATINVGNVNIQLNGINDSGVVVGQYWDYEYIYSVFDNRLGGFANLDVHTSHPFRWSSTAGFTDLGSFFVPAQYGVAGGSANALNSSGTIVGYSFVTNDPFNGLTYDAFSYQGSGPLTPLQAPPNSQSQATSLNDDGAIVGSSNGAAVIWQHGVPSTISPSFAPQFPSAAVHQHMLFGTSFDQNFNAHGWTIALAAAKPVISSVTPSQGLLWPPNKKMVPVSITVVATESGAPSPACRITGVTSNEPGTGEWQITGALTLTLQADRLGTGNGRIYTIGVACSDQAGNSATSSTSVVVPHDLGH